MGVPIVAKGLLRLLTAGSVDDGKSTLIGRLLYDSRSLYVDQMEALKRDSVRTGHAGGDVDLSLLTDGLRAEREQGITIDVAYRYFGTDRRQFILVDAPGHEQYTRNMVTGASTCDLCIVLLDARQGVLPQSKRHSYLASLLGIRTLVVAVNKMDLVDYRQDVFDHISADFRTFARALGDVHLQFIPVSALRGDNVVEPSLRMPWYDGPSLLAYLEGVEVEPPADSPLRLPVQLVIRPDGSFRGLAGTIAGGVVQRGDDVVVLPSRRRSKVRHVSTGGPASAGQAVVVVLEDDLDVGRGDMLVAPAQGPKVLERVEATVVWLQDRALEPGSTWWLKHTTNTVPATVTSVLERIDVHRAVSEPASALRLNDVGRVRLEVSRPIVADAYEVNRATGSFILIDRLSNGTAGAGMIRTGDESVGPTAETDAVQRVRREIAERLLAHGMDPALVGDLTRCATMTEAWSASVP
ncbi:MAG TPA: GTP-binding protein [Candidatus Xenobia bacterium]